MLEYETSALLAHIADQAHEHMPSGEISWHHTPHVPEMNASEPILLVGVAVLVLAVVVFAVYRWRAARLRGASA